MRRAYTALLRLYPAEHRDVFAAEMLDTFDRAHADWRRRGTLAFLCFAGWELTGLLQGLITEWMAKRSAGHNYVSTCSRLKGECDLPEDAAGMRKHVERLVRNMEFAIAHHDFPKARFYSEQERVARERLERLVNV